MYVIGTNSENFLDIERTYTGSDADDMWSGIVKVTHQCDLCKATVFPCYGVAKNAVEEIKERQNDIYFENDDIFGSIFEKEKFDLSNLKVYKLIPTEC